MQIKISCIEALVLKDVLEKIIDSDDFETAFTRSERNRIRSALESVVQVLRKYGWNVQ